MIIYFETKGKARQIAAKSSNLKSLDKNPQSEPDDSGQLK